MALLMETTWSFRAMFRASFTQSISFWQKAGFSWAKAHSSGPPTMLAYTLRPGQVCLRLLFTTPQRISSMTPVLRISVWTPRSRFPAWARHSPTVLASPPSPSWMQAPSGTRSAM